ncbi:MAG TPA: tRNA epoxyqueuosine(34) reductase QueG [Gemmatimonadales bacterium]|nr:tRNA epoxyqueuosine(34) reductase QueG [Gemmatimonadales bacterium]
MTLTAAAVEAEALRIGFVACGIATLEDSRRADALDAWLRRGYAGTMGYLPRQARKRKAPSSITAGARSAVVVLENYASQDEDARGDDLFRVARYARGMDYHIVTHGRLHRLSEWLKANGAGLAHTWVDDSPVPERELAERAGLGWIGKNTMLINPRIGSYTIIGTVFTDLEFETAPPVVADHCGTCTRCIDACPTGAFVEPRMLDASRCISYLTIEHKADPAPELASRLDGWAFGCDVCNDVCPWNVKFAEATTVSEFDDRHDPDRNDPGWFERMNESEFRRRYADTPLARPGLDRMRRNVRLAVASRRTGGA